LMIDHARQEYDEDDNCTRSFLMVEKNRDGPSFEEIPFQVNWGDMSIRQGYPDEELRWPVLKKEHQ